MALGLQSPWQVQELSFAPNVAGREELHLTLGFPPGSRFPDATGTLCPVHDTVLRQWQHLRFFEHAGYLHGAVPRIKTPDGKVVTVPVPWARPGRGFTLLFEAFAMALIERAMPVNRVAELLRVNPQRLWTVFTHWVGQARAADDPSAITRLGVDATSTRKGHHDVTLGVDLDAGRVIPATEGNGKETLDSIQKHLADQGVDPGQIKEVSIDLSPSFIAGVKASFPSAEITFDRCHVVKLLNAAMDTVRKVERKEHAALQGHQYTFLNNPDHRSDPQRQELAEMIRRYPTLGEAYRLRTLFNDRWAMPDKPAAEAFLTPWCAAVEAAKIPAFMKLAKTVRAHWRGIVHYVASGSAPSKSSRWARPRRTSPCPVTSASSGY